MNETQAKTIAASVEVLIYVSIGLFLIQRQLAKAYQDDLKTHFKDHRQNPVAVLTSGLVGQDPKETFQGWIGQRVTELFKQFLSFLTPIFSSLTSIFSIFQTQINAIRNILKPTRDFFQQAAQVFYNQIQNFTIGMLYSLHKIRNTMRRTFSGFNLLFHSLEHTKNSIESVVNSEPVALAEKFGSAVDWIQGKASRFCFHPMTIINLMYSQKKKIQDLKVGDRLADGSLVLTKHVFQNDAPLYSYQNVWVSGSHLVKHEGKWCRVDQTNAVLSSQTPSVVYSLTTDSHLICINNVCFRDYSESSDQAVNWRINQLILEYVNAPEPIPAYLAYESPLLEHAWDEQTTVLMKDGTTKYIGELQIGDELFSYSGKDNQVIGCIQLLPSATQWYQHKQGKQIVSANMKVLNKKNEWVCVECAPEVYDRFTLSVKRAYHVATSANQLTILADGMTYRYLDYLEFTNSDLDQTIESLVIRTEPLHKKFDYRLFG